MKRVKKLLGLITAAALTMSVCVTAGVEPAAVSASTGDITIQNVRFMANGAEIFTIDEAKDASVTADVVLNCPKDKQDGILSTILASYDSAGFLKEAQVKNYDSNDVIQGMPTISSSAISVSDDISELRLFVWNNLDEMQPIDKVYTLSVKSRDTRIKEFNVTLDDSTYKGWINHDTKHIRVYVPTSEIGNGSTMDTNHNIDGDMLGTLNGIGSRDTDHGFIDYQRMGLSSFQSAVQTAAPVVKANEDAGCTVEQTGVSGYTNGVERFTYTVTAENGEKAVYTADIASMAYNLRFDADNAHLGSNGSNSGIWSNLYAGTNARFGASGQYRAGMFNHLGKNGDGFWQYVGNKEQVLKNVKFAGTVSPAGIGNFTAFDTSSPLSINFGEESSTGRGRYAIFSVSDNNAKASYNNVAYNIPFGYYSTAMRQRNEMVAVMDYKIEKNTEDTAKGNLRVQIFNGTDEWGQSGSDFVTAGPEVQLRPDGFNMRAVPGDSGFSSRKATNWGYTQSVGNSTFDAADGNWHRLEMVSSIMPGFEKAAIDGSAKYSYGVMTEIYLDGVYRGYTYKVDYQNSSGYMSGAQGKGAIIFTFGNNTDMKFSMDNVMWGTPFDGSK